MNSRRSKPVRLVSSNSQSIEVGLGESSMMGSSSIDNTVYCCVAKGNKILYSHNSNGCELETLAVLCLENAPAFHKWYFHTVGARTFGFLMVDGHTYFAIVDPSVGNLAILRLLEHIQEGFKKVVKNGFHDELVPIIQRLIASLENMPKSAFALDENSEQVASSDGSVSTEAPLLGIKHHEKKKKKMKDKVVQSDDVVEDHADGAVNINVAQQTMGTMSLQRSSSSSRPHSQQPGRRLWWRHVKIVVAADVIICLVLFGAWLAVCKGFHCVSGK
ncbi:phytolongin Phyl1.1-like [Musa acuminata AAA Group]|uniref:phytolongin Phyl1.1-like n=1 Tax=Musa acuminata AAA Group TaxID=214697 RepID=UPI0031D89F1F